MSKFLQDENGAGLKPGPSSRSRALAALAIGLACGLLVVYNEAAAPWAVPDFDQTWFAASALLEGRNPYALIGEGLEYHWPWPYYYPLMAPVSVLPLGWLPLEWARVVFVSAPAALLAFLLSRDGFHRLAFFASGAFLMNVKLIQWGPLMVCGLLIPWMGAFIAAKPNLGLGSIAGARSLGAGLQAFAGASALTLVAFALQPMWFQEWWGIVQSSPHFLSIVAVPFGGPLLLAALLRWRRWEARLLLALALIPQTPGVAGALPLLLIPRSFRTLLIVAILSYLPPILASERNETFAEWANREALMMLLAVFLPLLIVVLRLPNVGPVPAWIERRVSRWPEWLRGRSGPAADPVSILVSPTHSHGS